MITTPERADEYMERIQRVYDEHMDMLEKLLEDDEDEADEVVKSMVLAEYNFSGLAAMYDLSPVEFCEYVEKAMALDDVDIWLDLLIKVYSE